MEPYDCYGLIYGIWVSISFYLFREAVGLNER